MPASQTGRSRSTAKAKSTRQATDAIALLEADHRAVEKLFRDYEKTDSSDRKEKLSAQICLALKVHTRIEEEIFYPAARDALKANQEEMVDEAIVEHASAKALIGEIEQMEVDEDLYDAKVKVLSEMIEHHVGEEEKQFFPACRRTDMDLDALGARMAARKAELTRKLARPNGHRVM
jgi:hemerythrin superfamily protein